MLQDTAKHIHWNDIDQLCAIAADRIWRNHPLDVEIIPIARGGLIPATIIANNLGKPIKRMIAVKSYANRSQQDIESHCLPQIGSSELRNIIFVEDIIDTGLTAAKLIKYYGDMKFISLVGKPDGLNMIEPNLLWRPPVIVDNGIWVHFPWEGKHAKIRD